MSEVVIEVGAKSRANPEAVFALLKDGATWPEWSLFTGFALEAPAAPDPLGVGCIRVFSTRYTRAREQVVELVPGVRLAYTLLSGLPLRDYRAVVDLIRERDGGCRIRWGASFRPDPAWTGWFWRRFMRWTLRQVAEQLAAAAERA
jgi:hypothetical protein